jgi:hypothetical protein
VAFSKASALKIINPILGTAAAVQLFTMVLFTFFEDSIPIKQIRDIHVIGGYVLLGLVVIHLYLNWTWIKSNFFKKRSKA